MWLWLTTGVWKPLEAGLPFDHFQVAYVQKPAADTISMLMRLSKLLESLAAYARLLFIDFSSA